MTILILAAALAFQEGALDILDGETLYEEGWLFTLGYETTQRAGSADTSSEALSAHYGLRYDIQLSAIVPYVNEDRESGFGDTTLIAKWRMYRWNDPGVAFNLALIGGLNVPTGDADVVSPSWDPFLGIGATHEPGRWRFNSFVAYRHNGGDADHFKEGDEIHAEIAVGNRFWLEPYPGPFMRFDAAFRYRHAWRDRLGGDALHDSGGDRFSMQFNLAFRPRPSLDFQVSIELPLSQHLNGVQVEDDYTLFFVFGVRI